MARGRIISKSISQSIKLASLYDIPMDDIGLPGGAEFCQLLYTWINTHTDDYGQLSAEPLAVKLTVLPASPRPTSDFKKALEILQQVKLIKIHPVANVLRITGFEKHQTFRPDRPRQNNFPELHANGMSWYDTGIPMDDIREVKLSKDKLSTNKNTLGESKKKPSGIEQKAPQQRQKIVFDYEEGRFVGISKEVSLWQQAYPAVDVLSELLRAATWAMANPKNRKSNWERFIVNWLSRAQDKAPSRQIRSPAKDGTSPYQPGRKSQPLKPKNPKAEKIWEQAKEKIKAKLNHESFDTWFLPTAGYNIKQNKLVVAVPNPFFVNWLEEHYSGLISEALGGKSIKFVATEADVSG